MPNEITNRPRDAELLAKDQKLLIDWTQVFDSQELTKFVSNTLVAKAFDGFLEIAQGLEVSPLVPLVHTAAEAYNGLVSERLKVEQAFTAFMLSDEFGLAEVGLGDDETSSPRNPEPLVLGPLLGSVRE